MLITLTHTCTTLPHTYTTTGEGMPNPKKRCRGDLKVKFRVVFPELSDQQRQQIRSILENTSSPSSSSSSR